MAEKARSRSGTRDKGSTARKLRIPRLQKTCCSRTIAESISYMIRFDAAHKAVHYPDDRRFRIWIRPSILAGIAIAIAGIIAAAWIEVAIAGLPPGPAIRLWRPRSKPRQ